MILQDALLTNEQLPPTDADPRVAAAFEDPLRHEYHHASRRTVLLVHTTKRSELRVGAAMDHLIECPAPTRTESRMVEDGGLVTVATVLQPGQKLRVVKFVAYGWPVSLPAAKPQTRPIPPASPRPRPSQPAGREPVHRQPTGPAN